MCELLTDAPRAESHRDRKLVAAEAVEKKTLQTTTTGEAIAKNRINILPCLALLVPGRMSTFDQTSDGTE